MDYYGASATRRMDGGRYYYYYYYYYYCSTSVAVADEKKKGSSYIDIIIMYEIHVNAFICISLTLQCNTILLASVFVGYGLHTTIPMQSLQQRMLSKSSKYFAWNDSTVTDLTLYLRR